MGRQLCSRLRTAFFLKLATHRQVEFDKFVPRYLVGKITAVIRFHAAHQRAFFVDGAQVSRFIEMATNAVAAIKEGRLWTQADAAAALAATVAGEGLHFFAKSASQFFVLSIFVASNGSSMFLLLISAFSIKVRSYSVLQV